MRNYDSIMKAMNERTMAELRVHLITVNNSQLYYVTSSGQLFPTSEYEAAVQHEFDWLNYNPDTDVASNSEPDSSDEN